MINYDDNDDVCQLNNINLLSIKKKKQILFIFIPKNFFFYNY